MKSLSPKTFLLFLVAAILLGGELRLVHACGPFTQYAIFTFSKHPDFPLDKFTRGELGVLQPSYARSYLYAAYRLMQGGSFNPQEQQALTALWNERLDLNSEKEIEDWSTLWLEARKKVGGVTPQVKMEVYRKLGDDSFNSFLNCHEDAFRIAVKTLEERIAKFGANSSEVKEWVAAQDQVFANCGGGQSIPEQSTSTSDALLRADREYQLAAAHFYATNFDEARTRFEKIASDQTSPWREAAQYLSARSLIRKASLGPEATRKDTLAQAEAQLKKVLAENKESVLRQSAQKLLNLVKLRLHPEERLQELAQSLLNTKPNDDLKQELWDYTLLLDSYQGDGDVETNEDLKKALDAKEKDDLTDWLINFEAEPKDSLEHSIEKWEKTNSLPWLIASLSKVNIAHAKSAPLLSAAERIEPSSPAYATAQFHLIRLLLEKGDRTNARKRLDALLSAESALPASAVNQFRHQRMLLATDLEDFLRYAQRQPAAFSWDDDGRERPIDLKEDEELKQWAGRAMFDVDSTRILNAGLPLSLLREAATSRVLPEHTRRQLALAAWTRAAILGDAENGKALAPVAISLAPELKPYLDDYLSAANGPKRKAAALYAILKSPGLQPYVDSSTGRLVPLTERSSYRDNWWCEFASETGGADDSDETLKPPAPPIKNIELEFLSEAQKTSAKRERAQLIAFDAAPNYLAREVIEWVNATPNDPRAPEALHIVVTATRYGCTNKETGKWSKAAYQLLHRRYPRSVWAKKTPYWFNG